jgi:hypothetical protein
LTEDLNTGRVSAKFIPRVLAIKQKEQRLSVATNLLQEAEAEQNFMEGIITRNETWVFGNDPETRRQCSHWKSPESPRPKKAR